MLLSTLLLACASVSAVSASPLRRRQGSSQAPVVVDATYDGSCYYPKADEDDFELDEYLGRWYQVAGTVAPFTAGCKCVYAEYSLNTNGTVRVFNSCELDGREITIEGTATALDENLGYGEEGVFRVQFPGQPPPDCPGPNYIVQDIEQDDDDDYDDDDDDGNFAIVQASNFSTLFLLSRQQSPPTAQIDAWLERARRLGTNMTDVVRTDQTGCQFT